MCKTHCSRQVTPIQTILVDYFFGNPVPEGADFAKFDVVSWVGSVKPGARGAIDKVVEVLKAQGVTKFAATGYCFGGSSSALLL